MRNQRIVQSASFFSAVFRVPKTSWILLVTIIIASGSYYYFAHGTRVQLDKDRQAQMLAVASARIDSDFHDAMTDLTFIAGGQTLARFLDKPRASNKRSFSEHLARWLRYNREYFHANVMGLDGIELVAISVTRGVVEIVPDQRLEYQGKNPAFRVTAKLAENQVFRSPFDLRAENGRIVQPLRPTIRFSTPVFDSSHRKRGVLLLNYDGQIILDQMAATGDGRLQLVNLDGYWLKGMRPEDEWGFMYPEKAQRTFGKAFPTAWSNIRDQESGNVQTPDGLFSFRTRHRPSILALTAGEVTSVPSSHVYTWKLIAFTPRAVQIEQERKLLVRIASIDMLSILVLALGTWWQIRIEIDHQRSEVTMQQQATLLDLAQDAILITNGKQEIMYWNRGAEDQFGWKSEEVLGKIPFELLHEVLPTSPENILAACASAGYWEGEVTRTTRSGSTVISRTRAVWQRDSSGDRVLAINHDITSRKHAEARFLVAIPALVVTLDPEFRIKMWNPATVVASGLTFSQVRDKPLQTCGVQWLSNDIEAQITAQLQAGSDGKMELQFVRDETTRYVSAHVLSVTADAESGAGILLVGTDITDRINLESHRVRSQKLEAIGQLAAGVAHEINSPIQFVGDNNLFLQDAWGGINDLLAISRTMRKEAGAGAIPGETLADFDRTAEHLDIDFVMSEFPEAIERSLVGIRRVAEIVKAMKGFSHIGAVEMKPSDLNREIEMTATVCRNEWKFVAKLELLLDPELPLVPCFEGKMNQVFLNLIVNAAHAITDRFGSAGDSMGRITITTVHDKDWAEIRIRDNGGGIPEKFRSKVFDPFFTTKEVGRGTGQGLALVHTVVQAHEGKLRFESTEGQGTTFFVCLPLRPNGHSA